MAASETEILGVNVLLKADSTGDGTADAQIGGQTSASLEVTEGVIDVNTKEAGLWRDTLNGPASWSITADQLYTEDDESHAVGANGIASVEIEYDPGGGTETEAVKGLTQASVDLTADVSETSTLEDDLWEQYICTGLQADLNLTCVYFDPESPYGAALKLLLQARDADDVVDVTVDFGVIQLKGQVRPCDRTISFPGNGERAELDFTLASEGIITPTPGTLDSGFAALLTSFFEPSPLQVLLEYQDGGSPVTGATAWNGQAWIASINLDASFGEALTVNADLTGNGPLNRFVQ